MCYAVERSVRIREVEGSNPFRSTKKSCEILYFTAFLNLLRSFSWMRTERIRRILEILRGIDPKRFASEKQHIEKRERRFVGFVEPSTGALFAFSG